MVKPLLVDMDEQRALIHEESPASSDFGDEKLLFDSVHDPRLSKRSLLVRPWALVFWAIAMLRRIVSSFPLRRIAATGPFLLPSFVACRIFPGTAQSPSEIAGTPHPTAWLDGLRGVAAWVVFNYHIGLDVFRNVGFGYGFGENNRFLIQLPFVRLLFSGDAAVSTFLVIAGYALSIKPVKLMNATPRDGEALLKTFSSAAFRRPMRLYLPSWIATALVLITFQMGVFEYVRWMTIEEPHTILTGYPPNLGYPFDTWREAWYDFGNEAVKMFDLFHENPKVRRLEGNHFNAPLWTIPMEFRASLLLYVSQLAVANLDANMRMATVAGLTLCAIWGDRFEMVSFWGGFFLAELDYHLQKKAKQAAVLQTEEYSTRRKRFNRTALWTTFVIGLYLLSYPEVEAQNTPGFRTLASWVPWTMTLKQRHWPGIGALTVVFAISRLEALQNFFKSTVIRYIGLISFSLYLLHGMMIVYLGFAMLYTTSLIFGRETLLATSIAFITAWAITLGATIWAADIFWRAVDIPIQGFGRTVENWFARPPWTRRAA